MHTYVCVCLMRLLAACRPLHVAQSCIAFTLLLLLLRLLLLLLAAVATVVVFPLLLLLPRNLIALIKETVAAALEQSDDRCRPLAITASIIYIICYFFVAVVTLYDMYFLSQILTFVYMYVCVYIF